MSWLSVLAVLIVAALGAWLLAEALRRLTRMRAMEASLQGFSYLLSGDPDRAIAVLTKVAATGNLEAYFALGSLFRRQGELERAIQLHRNILKAPALLPEQRLRGLTELGRDFRTAQLWVQAIEVLRQAVAQPGSELELRGALEELRDGLLAAGEPGAAAEIQDRVAGGKIDPLGAHLWAEAALAALARGEAGTAIAAAGRARKADPDSIHARFAQIAALSLKRGAAETRQAALDLAELGPQTAEVVLSWLVQRERQAGTVPELEPALEERSRRGLLAPQTALLRAQMARDRSDLDAAAAQLQGPAGPLPRLSSGAAVPSTRSCSRPDGSPRCPSRCGRCCRRSTSRRRRGASAANRQFASQPGAVRLAARSISKLPRRQ